METPIWNYCKQMQQLIHKPGGALLNEEGNLIGINSSIYSKTGLIQVLVLQYHLKK